MDNNKVKRKRGRRAMVMFLASMIVSAAAIAPSAQERSGRIMPPADLKCDRNDLTLYDGRVLAYRRRFGSTFLRIRTNYDTTETVTIRHPRTDDPSKFYRLNGEQFLKSDWARIESRKKSLKPGMRANVWVCRDNPAIQPVVDWRPDDTGANPRSR
jgi:hypothetical protein